MYGNRQQMRQFYHDVWQKMQTPQSLTSLEQIVAQVIQLHPEYHKLLGKDATLEQEFFVENGQTNPYLHMGLHISLHEQISTDRPAGIQAVYQQLIEKFGSAHEAEHQMMECLAESLWQAQRSQSQPSEQDYLDALKALLSK